MGKKVLIISATFYPINTPRSHRATELAKEFSKQGHDVTILTLRDNKFHDDFEKKYRVRIKGLGNRKWKAYSIKSSGAKRIFERVVVRFSNLLFEYPDIELKRMVKNALKKESGYDLMISIAVPYPVHWGVAAARTSHHSIAKVWVADCGDPYMGDTMDTFRKPFYFKYIEKRFCRKADFLSVPTEGSVNGYYKEFHNKISVIPQGFNFEESPIYQGKINNPVPTFAYAGGFIPGSRDPRELLSFLCELNEEYRFNIYTGNKDLVKPFEEISGNKIQLKDYIPRVELIFELSKMDFLVNFTNGTTLATPSKLIDYSITGRPVLSVDTGKLDKEAVVEFLKGNYRKQISMPGIENYNISNVVKQFLHLYDSAVLN